MNKIGSTPRLIHLTTTDMSLDWLLRPQLEAFARAGFEVIGMSAPGPHVAALEASGIAHVAVQNLIRSASASRDLRALRELYRNFRTLRPTIVHTHNPKPGVLGRLAARAARVPIVVNTVHGLYAQPTDRLRRRFAVYSAERIAATCSDMELLQNVEDEAVLRRLRVPARRIRILGNGVDLTRFDPAQHVRGAPHCSRFPWYRRGGCGVRCGRSACGGEGLSRAVCRGGAVARRPGAGADRGCRAGGAGQIRWPYQK